MLAPLGLQDSACFSHELSPADVPHASPLQLHSLTLHVSPPVHVSADPEPPMHVAEPPTLAVVQSLFWLHFTASTPSLMRVSGKSEHVPAKQSASMLHLVDVEAEQDPGQSELTLHRVADVVEHVPFMH